MGIRLLGALVLEDAIVNGIKLAELSGLAWDEDEQILYALSDKGYLFHLRPRFERGILVNVDLLHAFRLRDRRGKALRGKLRDSEGLAIERGADGVRGNSELIVSFERVPRILHYRPDGRWLAAERLPASLRDIRRYSDPNEALEAVAVHPQLGILTGPELPMKGTAEGVNTIYSLDGGRWQYPSHAAPRSALVDMVALPDGSLLTLERSYVSLLDPVVISLRRVWLSRPGGRQADRKARVDDVAVLDNSQGWAIDNFEGLTRHRGNRFFMVSDDNQKFYQRTLLVYFELTDQPATRSHVNPP